MANKVYDDLSGTLCLICKSGSDLKKLRQRLKTEFRLVEAKSDNVGERGIGSALVMPLPSNPEKDYVYRIRFSPDYRHGPLVDFKYRQDLDDSLLKADPRGNAVRRALEFLKVIHVIDWAGVPLNLSYFNQKA